MVGLVDLGRIASNRFRCKEFQFERGFVKGFDNLTEAPDIGAGVVIDKEGYIRPDAASKFCQFIYTERML